MLAQGVSLCLGPSPALLPVLLRDQTSVESSPWHLLPALGLLPHPGGPSLPGPRRPGDSGAQMESRAQRWAVGEPGTRERVCRQEKGQV